jgi:IS30 family transposase
MRAIARMLGRSPNTISYELKHNQVNDEYIAIKAQAKAVSRRRTAKFQGRKIVGNRFLREFVDRALVAGQSPETIAGRLKAGLEPELPYVSRDTIEEYVRSAHGRQIEYELKVIKAEQKKHRRRKRSAPERVVGDPKAYIDDRPACITNREGVGDLEVDFIVSGKQGKGYCLTAADRKLRVGFIRKVLPVSVGEALRTLQEIKRVFPELQSISTDNDILWAYHKKLEKLLGVPFYFCRPYSSWEKGSIENYNKQARHYVRKGSDISQYSEEYLQVVETKLNSRYMAVLGYQTPTEALVVYRKSKVS